MKDRYKGKGKIYKRKSISYEMEYGKKERKKERKK